MMRPLLGTSLLIAVSLLLAACGGGQVAVDAGDAQELLLGATAQLEAAVERDGNWSYTWTLDAQPSGSTAVVEAQGATATLTPSVAGDYALTVHVSDGKAEGSASVQLTFLPNQMPTAVAGENQVVAVGELVELDGRGSSDPDAQSLAFTWSILERPADSTASLNDPTSRTPSFVADLPGRYLVELSVHDGGFTITDRLTVTTHRAPIAVPGPDLSGVVGQELVLDGSGSMDPDDDVLQFSWTLLSAPQGSTASIADADRSVARFTPDVPGSFLLDLSVSDGRLVGNARITVQALPIGGVIGSVVFVSPSGSDDNPGTEALPLATIAAALVKVQEVEQLYRIQLSEGVWSEPFAHELSGLTVEIVGPESGEARLVGPANLFRLSGTSHMTLTRLSLETPATAIIGASSQSYVGLNQVECVARVCVESGRFLSFSGGIVSVRDSKLIGQGDGTGLSAAKAKQLSATNIEVLGHETGVAVYETALILRNSLLVGVDTGVSIIGNSLQATVLLENNRYSVNAVGVTTMQAQQVRIVGGLFFGGTGVEITGGALTLQDVKMSQMQIGVDMGGIVNTGELVTVRGLVLSGVAGPAFRVNQLNGILDLGDASTPGNNQLSSSMGLAVWDKRKTGATGLITLSHTTLNGQPIPVGTVTGTMDAGAFKIEGANNKIHVY